MKYQRNFHGFSLPPYVIDNVISPAQMLTLEREGAAQTRNLNWGHELVGIPMAWHATRGDGVLVAILDTGVDTKHPDLVDSIVEVKDFTGEGIEDANGHGTHCAGMVAARQKQSNFVGVAPEAGLIICKVLSNTGGGSIESICTALQWLLDQKRSNGSYAPDIISMSLGGYTRSPQLFRLLYEITALGVHIVVAAGNAGSAYRNSIAAPACYGCGIVVGACDSNGNPSGFSSRGGETFCLAPGDNICSTYPGGNYAVLSGTSMATPFVAGYAALILSYHKKNPHTRTPIENVDDMKKHILPDLTHAGWHTNDAGYGVLQLSILFFNKAPFE